MTSIDPVPLLLPLDNHLIDNSHRSQEVQFPHFQQTPWPAVPRDVTATARTRCVKKREGDGRDFDFLPFLTLPSGQIVEVVGAHRVRSSTRTPEKEVSLMLDGIFFVQFDEI